MPDLQDLGGSYAEKFSALITLINVFGNEQLGFVCGDTLSARHPEAQRQVRGL